MADLIKANRLYSEDGLFSQGMKAAEFAFIAQDARDASGSLREPADTRSQASWTLENLNLALQCAGLELEHLVTLTVFLTDYRDAAAVENVLATAFPRPERSYPATTILGVMGLDGGCRVRIDAMAASDPHRESIIVRNVPLSTGARCHGVRVGDLLFLSGVDAANERGRSPVPASIEAQTVEVIDRIEAILKSQELRLGDVFRTFMFIPGAQHRPGYRESRRKRYQGIFGEDEFPANSGIYIKDLGEGNLLKSVPIAYRGRDKALVSSPKVWLAPGSFSQAFRVGKWLFVSGQDAIREVPYSAQKGDVLSPNVRRSVSYEAEAIGDLAGQTIASLRHIEDIVEEAGGAMEDIVKTTVYLIAGQDRATVAAAYREFFQSHRKDKRMPAGLSVEVRELAPDCLVEIDAVAHLGS